MSIKTVGNMATSLFLSDFSSANNVELAKIEET